MRRLCLVPVLLVVLGACGPGQTAPPTGVLRVVATSSVFGDIVRNVGGDHVSVTSLVPKGADIHTYQPAPSDLRAVADANVVVMNGLGLDDWLAKTISAGSTKATIVRLGVDLAGVALLPGETPDTQNPHLWMDVSAGARYAMRISDALQAAAPADAASIRATTAAYLTRLASLDSWVRSRVATVPAEQRKIVVFHDALAYFARAYDLTVVGVAVKAPGQDPSAGEIADLIDTIRATGVRAIFSENQFPTVLVDQIARETGARVVASLFDDSLGNDPVSSYEALITWDTEQIVGALQ